MGDRTGMSGCRAPQVPIRTMLRVRCSDFTSIVLRSILARASSSFITMSILSVPMPVERALMRFPRRVPVWVTNSRFCRRISTVSKRREMFSTRPGSPTTMIWSAISSG